MSASPDPEIAIIGAGLTGLFCAQLLRGRGLRAQVFDKGRRPGGRVATRHGEGADFDHGAQYLSVRDPRLLPQVSAWLQAGVLAPWEGRLGSMTGGAPVETRYVGVPGMSALARHLAEPLAGDLHTGIRVVAVEPQGRRWSLRSEAGASLGSFDCVLVTVPAPQAAPLLAAAPALHAQATAARLAPCWAVMAAFDQRVPNELDGIFLPREGALSWAARDSSKPGRAPGERWVLHGAPAWSEAHLEDDSGAVGAALLAAFAAHLDQPLPPARFVAAHRWRYALVQVAAAPAQGCLFDEALGLGAGGDWCAGPRAEAALQSGLALCDQLQREAERAAAR